MQIFALSSCAPTDQESIYPYVNVPTYGNALEITRKCDTDNRYEQLRYFVEVPFPADEVVKHYDKNMISAGFELYLEDGYGDRRWKIFNQSSLEYNSVKGPPCLYISSWRNYDKQIRATLILAYNSALLKNGESESKSRLEVNFALQHFFDTNTVDAFFERVTAANELENFTALLREYTKNNGEVDFNKAKKDHPHNKWLNEYSSIVRGK
jgi:hypothetical protein